MDTKAKNEDKGIPERESAQFVVRKATTTSN